MFSQYNICIHCTYMYMYHHVLSCLDTTHTYVIPSSQIVYNAIALLQCMYHHTIQGSKGTDGTSKFHSRPPPPHNVKILTRSWCTWTPIFCNGPPWQKDGVGFLNKSFNSFPQSNPTQLGLMKSIQHWNIQWGPRSQETEMRYWILPSLTIITDNNYDNVIQYLQSLCKLISNVHYVNFYCAISVVQKSGLLLPYLFMHDLHVCTCVTWLLTKVNTIFF